MGNPQNRGDRDPSCIASSLKRTSYEVRTWFLCTLIQKAMSLFFTFDAVKLQSIHSIKNNNGIKIVTDVNSKLLLIKLALFMLYRQCEPGP